MSDEEMPCPIDADYWQAPNTVLRQPKREIGDYVESEGMPVPARYASFDDTLEAVGQGRTVMVRSEHRDEYDGPSGLLNTCLLNQTAIDYRLGLLGELLYGGVSPDEALRQFKNSLLQAESVRRYLAITRQQADQFSLGVSFSFWRYIPGTNITMVADDAVADRYHIVAKATDENGHSGWITNQAGIAAQAHDPSRLISLKKRAELIRLYESVRNLPRFSSQECPIMEWQLDHNDAYWFLQYHKARRFQPYRGRIAAADYPAVEGWRKAYIVRGALGPFAALQAAIGYPFDYGVSESSYGLPETESASFDLALPDPALSEVLSRRRTAYFAAHDFPALYQKLADGHEARSHWFKPQASLALGRKALSVLPLGLQEKVTRELYMSGRMARFAIDAASDGLQAYWRLNPDSEQPVHTNF
ncbi:MAG: hypothetical protein AAB834_00735 [Patescibacteria group bacterium]